MDQRAKSIAEEASISAVVIRADGSREDLGVISYWHKNPIKRLQWALKHRLKEMQKEKVRE